MDRANVYVRDGDTGVYLYTHWSGTELPDVVNAALIRVEGRWSDGPYLARIILCEMVEGEFRETYGISARCSDGCDRIIVVDPDRLVIGYAKSPDAVNASPLIAEQSISDFCDREPEWFTTGKPVGAEETETD